MADKQITTHYKVRKLQRTASGEKGVTGIYGDLPNMKCRSFAMAYIEKAAGVKCGKRVYGLDNMTEGHYILLNEGHVMSARVLPNGKKGVL